MGLKVGSILLLGRLVGGLLSSMEGEPVGVLDGCGVGNAVGRTLGSVEVTIDGMPTGAKVGCRFGLFDAGRKVGRLFGIFETGE